MNTMLRILFAAGAALAVALTSAVPATGQRLSPETRDATYAQAFVQGEIVPLWGGPFLLSWKSPTTTAHHGDNLFLYRRDGQIQAKIRLWFEDASSIHIESAAGSARSGETVFVGNAWEKSGLVAGFFAQITGEGRIARVVRTTPFEPKAAAFGPDDSIWLFGLQAGPGRKLATAPPHTLIQRYGTDGKLLAQYLPSAEWRCAGEPHPAGRRPRIVAAGDRIGVISEACWEIVELSSSGDLLTRRPLPPAPGFTGTKRPPIMGAALTSSGLYVQFAKPGVYQLSPEGDAWQSVGAGGLGQPQIEPVGLLGADGDTLVLYGGQGKVHWRNIIE